MPLTAAESNRVALYYIPEVAWGTTPSSGVVRTMRLTSSSLVASKETETSQEIRADRMVPAIIEVAAMTSGDIEGELSAGTYDDFFQQFLLGAWTTSMNHWLVKGVSVAVTGANEITVAGADWTDYIVDGQWLKIEGFIEPENNGYVSINGTPTFGSGNTVITVDQTVVTEAGTANCKIMDAGDVVHVGTLVTLTGTTNVIDGGGTNPFGNLVVGQKIYVEGLGKETGTLTAESTDPAEGDTVTISDGVNSVTYEIRTNSALITPGNIHVALSGTENTLAASLEAAINGQYAAGNCDCSATVSTAVVTVTNNKGSGGSMSDSGSGITTVDFTGGVAANQGIMTVASLVDADSFTVEESLTTDSNAGGSTVVVKGSHLRNPGAIADITKQSVSAMTSFTDVSKTLLHDGLRVGSFSLSVEAGAIATVSMSFMGAQTLSTSATDLADTGSYTVLDTTITEVLNATDNVGTIKKDGTELTAAVMSIELSGDNSLREQKAVGNKFPAGIGYGRFSMEGSINVYFQDFTLYDAFIGHDTASLEFPFTDADNYHMIFRIPSLKFTSDPVSPGGIDEDIMEEIEFTAQRDGNLATMFMLDRFSSNRPVARA